MQFQWECSQTHDTIFFSSGNGPLCYKNSSFQDPSQKNISDYFMDLEEEGDDLLSSVMDEFESQVPEKKAKLS